MLGFGLQELQRSFYLFGGTRHAGRLLSTLATCVPNRREGTRVPQLQNQVYLPASRREISEPSDKRRRRKLTR